MISDVRRRWLSQNPPENRSDGSNALINACKEHRYLPVVSKRRALRREIYDRVASPGWQELGVYGQAPSVRVYETDQPVVYGAQRSFERGKHTGSKSA